MNERDTQELIHELSESLAPVSLVPRLRTSLGAIVGIWMGTAVMAVAWLGLRPDLLKQLSHPGEFLVVLTGMVLMAMGALVAGLATGIPGRERTVRIGGATVVAGFALAAGLGMALLLATSTATSGSLGGTLICLGKSCLVGFVPVMVGLYFVLRALPHRPLVTLAVVSVGALSLGAVVIQLTCTGSALGHVLFGHILAPFLGAALVVFPLVWFYRRMAGNGGSSQGS